MSLFSPSFPVQPNCLIQLNPLAPLHPLSSEETTTTHYSSPHCGNLIFSRLRRSLRRVKSLIHSETVRVTATLTTPLLNSATLFSFANSLSLSSRLITRISVFIRFINLARAHTQIPNYLFDLVHRPLRLLLLYHERRHEIDNVPKRPQQQTTPDKLFSERCAPIIKIAAAS